MPDLTAWQWALLAVGALLAGCSKTAIAGIITVPIALFAAVLPPRESTGVLLVLLLTGDLVAIWTYRSSVDWRLLARLVPPVLVGIAAGAVFLDRVDQTVMRRTLGVILLALAAYQVWTWVTAWRVRRSSGASDGEAPSGGGWGRVKSLSYGTLAGFTTMVANAGGPVMSLYLLSRRTSMLRFLGTTAWFFFGVNLVKLPVSAALGLVTADSLRIDVWLVPVVLAGTVLGRWWIRRMDQRTFEYLVLVFTVVGGVYLLR